MMLPIDGAYFKKWIHDDLGMTYEEFSEEVCYHTRTVARVAQRGYITRDMLYSIFERFDIEVGDPVIVELLGDDFDYDTVFG